MTELLKKDKKFEWTDSCEASFQELKKQLVSAPVLCLPDIQKDFKFTATLLVKDLVAF
jgi:hypothetical protein